jgi:hypothetical protein
MPRYLLDRLLNPGGDIRKSIATKLEEFDDVPADVPLIPLMLARPQAPSPKPQAASPKPSGS